MKATKLMVKFFLVISLFASAIIADDGHIGGGGFADDGHIGGGGYVCSQEEMDENGNCPDDSGAGFTDSVMIFVEDYLVNLLG